MSENKIARGNGPIQGNIELFSHIVQDSRTRLLALDIYGINFLFNLIPQGQSVAVSALHGLGNMVNAPAYSVDWHNFSTPADFIGYASQAGMYLVAGVFLGNVITKVASREISRIKGELPITIKDGVLLAQYGEGALPISTDLIQRMRGEEGKVLANTVLVKAAEQPPVRTPEEAEAIPSWAVGLGTISERWFHSSFWERAGAKNAKALILNTKQTDNSLLAAHVIRSQLKNSTAEIIIIDSDPDFLRFPNLDERRTILDTNTNSTLVNPYLELASVFVDGFTRKDASIFLPHDGKKRKTELEKITAKLSKMNDEAVIFLDGEQGSTEYRGLSNALYLLESGIRMTDNPQEANVVLHFGSGEITNDEDALKEHKVSGLHADALRLSVVCLANNEDTALANHDGTLSLQYVVNEKLKVLIEPHVKKSTPIWKLLRKISKRALNLRK